MALKAGKSVALNVTEEVWRTNIETPIDQDTTWTAYLSNVGRDDAGVVAVTENIGSLSRMLSAVADEPVTGVTNVRTLCEAITGMLQRWRAEDINNPIKSFPLPEVEPVSEPEPEPEPKRKAKK